MLRRSGRVTFAAVSSLLLGGASSPSGCNTSNDKINIVSGGEIAGAVAGLAGVVVGTIVIVEVNKSHHTIQGCVTVGPQGILVHNEGDKKTYSLTGITARVKVGDKVRVKGRKNKKQKDSAGDEDFIVTKISRDYGPCKAPDPSPVSTAAAAVAP